MGVEITFFFLFGPGVALKALPELHTQFCSQNRCSRCDFAFQNVYCSHLRGFFLHGCPSLLVPVLLLECMKAGWLLSSAVMLLVNHSNSATQWPLPVPGVLLLSSAASSSWLCHSLLPAHEVQVPSVGFPPSWILVLCFLC